MQSGSLPQSEWEGEEEMILNGDGKKLAMLHTGEKVLSKKEAEKVIKCSHGEVYPSDELLFNIEGPITLIRKDEDE